MEGTEDVVAEADESTDTKSNDWELTVRTLEVAVGVVLGAVIANDVDSTCG